MSRRTALAVLGVAAALLLAACSPMVEEVSPISSVSLPVSAAPSPSPSLALEFAGQFGHYNDSLDPHDFTISAGELDGQPCYQLDNEEYGVTVLVPENGYEVQAVVRYQGQQTTFEMPTFLLGYGTVSGSASLFLEDLTGDGTPDLVYIYGGGGTGQWGDHAKVIDLAAMEERPVTRDDAVLEGAVQLQFVALREDEDSDPQAIYQVTGPDGETVYGGFYYGLGLDVPPSQAPVFTYGYIEHIALADGQLVLSSAFSAGLSADPSLSGLGTLSAPFTYDPDSGSFSLVPDFTLSLYEPVSPSR